MSLPTDWSSDWDPDGFRSMLESICVIVNSYDGEYETQCLVDDIKKVLE